jgi:Mg/Co/Ni transporter MgtE
MLHYSAQNKYDLKESRKGFSIETALEKMDSIIEEVTTDKVTEILNSLTESEKEALLSTLKKKV